MQMAGQGHVEFEIELSTLGLRDQRFWSSLESAEQGRDCPAKEDAERSNEFKVMCQGSGTVGCAR